MMVRVTSGFIRTSFLKILTSYRREWLYLNRRTERIHAQKAREVDRTSVDSLVCSHIWSSITFIICLESWAYGWDADNQLFVASSASHPPNSNIYTGTETGSTGLTRNSRSSEMVRDLWLTLLPLTSRRPRIASRSSPTVPTICVSSIPPRT
jgi:hypothetical protein